MSSEKSKAHWETPLTAVTVEWPCVQWRTQKMRSLPAPCWIPGNFWVVLEVVKIFPTLLGSLGVLIHFHLPWLVGSASIPLCASCASHLHDLTLILGATHSFWLRLTNLICSCSFQALLCPTTSGTRTASTWKLISLKVFKPTVSVKTPQKKLWSK